jgi:hypothetical protein
LTQAGLCCSTNIYPLSPTITIPADNARDQIDAVKA